MTETYEIYSSLHTLRKRGLVSLHEADDIIRTHPWEFARNPTIISVEWHNGSVAYYLNRRDADGDFTGALAIAVVSRSQS